MRDKNGLRLAGTGGSERLLNNGRIADSMSAGALLLTEKDAAAQLRIGYSTLRKRRKQRKISFIQEGRLIRYRLDDLLKWISANEVRHG